MTTQNAELKNGIRSCLSQRSESGALSSVVDHFNSASSSKVYEALQEVWLEYGFDDDDHRRSDPIRDALEAVMECVWYQID
jgi:hypothetical protein